MALYSEDHPAGEQEPVYPINAVRNRALQMVETQVRQLMLMPASDTHLHCTL